MVDKCTLQGMMESLRAGECIFLGQGKTLESKFLHMLFPHDIFPSGVEKKRKENYFPPKKVAKQTEKEKVKKT